MPAFWLEVAKIAIKKRQTHLWIAVRPGLRARPLEIAICAAVGSSTGAARASAAAARGSRMEDGRGGWPPYDGVVGADVDPAQGTLQVLVDILLPDGP